MPGHHCRSVKIGESQSDENTRAIDQRDRSFVQVYLNTVQKPRASCGLSLRHVSVTYVASPASVLHYGLVRAGAPRCSLGSGRITTSPHLRILTVGHWPVLCLRK